MIIDLWFAGTHPAPNPFTARVAVGTENIFQNLRKKCGKRQLPIVSGGLSQPLYRFTGVARENQPTNRFTSKSFLSRIMKKHALVSLHDSALTATTRLPVRVCLRWAQARISGE